MKKLLLMLAAVGMIFTACEDNDKVIYEDPNSPLTGIKCANNEILYISTTCLPIAITSEGFNERMISNTYEDGIGRFVFDGDITNIPNDKFNDNKELEYIKIPNTIISIESYAFYRCSSLASVTIPNSVTSIGDSSFYGCYNLTSLTIGNGVTSIGNEAFSGCSSLTSVTIPNSVTSIGDSSFYGCHNLTSLTIGNGVTSIGNKAFSGCSGELIIDSKIVETYYYNSYYDANYPSEYGWLKDTNFSKLTIGNSITSIGYNVFAYCSSLIYVTISNSVTSIKKGAFYHCSSLASVTIGNGVTSIDEGAFNGCSSLTSVTIPNSVTSIGEGVFHSCSKLTSITIPDSVTSIGNYAFECCSSLTSVYCKATTPPKGGSEMFNNNSYGRKIYVPTASVEAYKSAEYWKDYASDIVGYDF